MKIKVKDLSTGAVKVPVKIVKKIANMTAEQIIKDLNLFDDLVDWHYKIQDEYHNVSEMYDGGALEHLEETLYEAYNDEDYDYKPMCQEILDKLEGDVVSKIFDLDDNAVDYYNTKMEALRG